MIKQLLLAMQAMVLTVTVTGLIVQNTAAGFFDTGTTEKNLMCAGTVDLELAGNSFVIDNLIPDKWYSKEKLLMNVGSLNATASIHIKNVVCVEDAMGAGVATTESELVAEEGGRLGGKQISGLGIDTRNIADYIDARLWYDSDNNGTYELITEGKLSALACHNFILGVIPGSPKFEGNGGGWGSYFEYVIGAPKMEVPLMAGQDTLVGWVSVWTAYGKLFVKYDTTSSGWKMDETHLYVGTTPPAKLAPGRFPYRNEAVPSPFTTDTYELPLMWSGKVYIAAHAADEETAWAKGTLRRFKIDVRFPNIPEGNLKLDYFNESDPREAKWAHWPTNAYQGDRVTFDIEFLLKSL